MFCCYLPQVSIISAVSMSTTHVQLNSKIMYVNKVILTDCLIAIENAWEKEPR